MKSANESGTPHPSGVGGCQREDIEQGPDGSSQIFIHPLLGCYSRAPTLGEALGKAPAKVKEYKNWLKSHGEDFETDPVNLKVCETIKGDWPVNMGDSVALFECDKQRLAEDDIQRYLRWMDYSWMDFQDLTSHIPREALDWKPKVDITKSVRTKRSIKRIIVHVALVQVWYLWKLREKGDKPFRYPTGLSPLTYARRVERNEDISLETLKALRRGVVYRLRNLREKELSCVTHHKPGEWTERTTPEAWTAGKVFRRFLWHEKLHMNTMNKLLLAYQSE